MDWGSTFVSLIKVKSLAKLLIPLSSLILKSWYSAKPVIATVTIRISPTNKSGLIQAFNIALSVYTLNTLDSFQSLLKREENHHCLLCFVWCGGVSDHRHFAYISQSCQVNEESKGQDPPLFSTFQRLGPCESKALFWNNFCQI